MDCEIITGLKTVKSQSYHLLTGIKTTKRTIYFKDFGDLPSCNLTPSLELEYSHIDYYSNSFIIPIPTYNGFPLLNSDCPTERYEVTDDDVISFLKTKHYPASVTISNVLYDILQNSKVQLYSYEDLPTQELLTYELPFTAQPYTPNTHLKINTNEITSYPSDIPLHLYQDMINNNPIIFDKEKTDELYNNALDVTSKINTFLQKKFNVPYIDWTGVKKGNYDLVTLLSNNSKGLIPLYKHYNKRTNRISLTLDNLEFYQKTIQDEEVNYFVQCIHKHKTLSRTMSTIKKSIIDRDYKITPTITSSDTYRLQTSNPNPQGFTNEIKSLITTKEGFKLLKLDVKGQDVHNLFEVVLQNPTLKEYYKNSKEPYFSILKYLGYNETEELKKIVKVPLLGILNGMGLKTAMSRVHPQYHQLVQDVYNLINTDKGYTTVKRRVSFLASTPTKRKLGYIGLSSIAVPKPHSNIENSILNSIFQLTSSEIFRLSLWAFLKHLKQGLIRINNQVVSEQDLYINLCVHDECIIYYKDIYNDKDIEDIIKYYFLPTVNNWSEMNGEIISGLKSYPRKEV